MCWAQKTKSFLVQNVRFSAQLAAPWTVLPWAATTLVPTPSTYAAGCIGCINPLFSLAVVHVLRLALCTAMQDGVAIRVKSVLCRIVEVQISTKCRPGVACLLSPASCPYFTAAFFWMLLRLPKSFSGTWYMTSPRSLFVFSLSFRCKLRPHFHLGFYALQSR